MDKYVGEANDDTDKNSQRNNYKKEKEEKENLRQVSVFVNKQCFLNDKDLTLRTVVNKNVRETRLKKQFRAIIKLTLQFKK